MAARVFCGLQLFLFVFLSLSWLLSIYCTCAGIICVLILLHFLDTRLIRGFPMLFCVLSVSHVPLCFSSQSNTPNLGLTPVSYRIDTSRLAIQKILVLGNFSLLLVRAYLRACLVSYFGPKTQNLSSSRSFGSTPVDSLLTPVDSRMADTQGGPFGPRLSFFVQTLYRILHAPSLLHLVEGKFDIHNLFGGARLSRICNAYVSPKVFCYPQVRTC